jgi:hypothetical protein
VASALYDRIFATTVACASKQPERVAAVMYVRPAIKLEVLTEMKHWPSGRVRTAAKITESVFPGDAT